MAEEIKTQLASFGQEHVMAAWDALSQDEQTSLLMELEGVNLSQLQKACAASIGNAADQATTVQPEPYKEVCEIEKCSKDKTNHWRSIGLAKASQGKLGVVLMAGGQGTRLGSSAPKGCYNIGLPSNKSLFQLQAERLLRLQHLAAASAGKADAEVEIPWYIMTSEFTDDDTKCFFADHEFFGLKPGQVKFFQQGTMPCVTESGRIIMESASKLARAPDGNGGLYMALARSGCLEDMETRGVEVVDCYCVDNALARLGDPLFVGYCCEQGADCGARVVAKAYPEERVGVFARRAGAVQVVEYSELHPEQACGVGPDGQLLYNWGNVAMHFFTRAFLKKVAEQFERTGVYHVARKNIPSVAGTVPGVKLELFIFDAFQLADKFALLEVKRHEEFAPVKNAAGSLTDSPDTARALVLDLHRSWIQAAGGVTQEDGTSRPCVEVSPLASYAGEGLQDRARGLVFTPSGTVMENLPVQAVPPPTESPLARGVAGIVRWLKRKRE